MRGAALTTDWTETVAERDFTHQWRLDRLIGTRYAVIIEARPVGQTCSRRLWRWFRPRQPWLSLAP